MAVCLVRIALAHRMPEPDRTNLEITVLRAFISRAAESTSLGGEAELGKLIGELVGYVWSDEEHRVVYECVRAARGRRGVRFREEMAAEATRMGHPDVDWDLYFKSLGSGTNLRELIRALNNNT